MLLKQKGRKDEENFTEKAERCNLGVTKGNWGPWPATEVAIH